MKTIPTAMSPNMGAAHAGPQTVSLTAVLLTTLFTLHAQSRVVQIAVEAQPVRLTVNGTTPTGTLGFNLAAGTVVELSRAEAESAKVIRAGGVDATLQIAQYLE